MLKEEESGLSFQKLILNPDKAFHIRFNFRVVHEILEEYVYGFVQSGFIVKKEDSGLSIKVFYRELEMKDVFPVIDDRAEEYVGGIVQAVRC